MRNLLLLAAVLVSLFILPALAQTAPPLTPTPIKAPACFPLINGNHAGPPRHVSGEVGQHIYWFCVVRDQVEPAGFSCAHGQCTASVLASAQQAVIKATAKVRVAGELYAEHVKFECGAYELALQNELGSLCRERANIYNAMVHQWLGISK